METKKRRLKKQYKIILYILLISLFIFIIYISSKCDSDIKDPNSPYNQCIKNGNGSRYCSRNYL